MVAATLLFNSSNFIDDEISYFEEEMKVAGAKKQKLKQNKQPKGESSLNGLERIGILSGLAAAAAVLFLSRVFHLIC